MAIQWPINNWGYGLHPKLVLDESDKLRDEEAVRRDLVLKMAEAMQRTERALAPAVGFTKPL